MIRDNNVPKTSDMKVKNMHKQAAVAIADVWQNWKIPGSLGDACPSTGMLLRVKWKYNKRMQKETPSSVASKWQAAIGWVDAITGKPRDADRARRKRRENAAPTTRKGVGI